VSAAPPAVAATSAALAAPSAPTLPVPVPSVVPPTPGAAPRSTPDGSYGPCAVLRVIRLFTVSALLWGSICRHRERRGGLPSAGKGRGCWRRQSRWVLILCCVWWGGEAGRPSSARCAPIIDVARWCVHVQQQVADNLARPLCHPRLWLWQPPVPRFPPPRSLAPPSSTPVSPVA
jgi:hypothetical protein